MAETREVGAGDDSGRGVDLGLAELRAMAEGAQFGDPENGKWWHAPGDQVLRVADGAQMADCFAIDPECSDIADHIAAADPATVLTLIARVVAAEAAVERVRERLADEQERVDLFNEHARLSRFNGLDERPYRIGTIHSGDEIRDALDGNEHPPFRDRSATIEGLKFKIANLKADQ